MRPAADGRHPNGARGGRASHAQGDNEGYHLSLSDNKGYQGLGWRERHQGVNY